MSGGGNGKDHPAGGSEHVAREPLRAPGRDAVKALPRRFYSAVTVGPAGNGAGAVILLDARPVRTPGKRELALPTVALAQALAAEWAAQATVIDPTSMPLTRLANTAIDGVAGRMPEVAADVATYAGSDMLCYRAEFPEGLVQRQGLLWGPVLAWAKERFGAEFATGVGIAHVTQPPAIADRLAAAIAPLDAFRLTALHVMTTLMGSAVLGLAVLEGRLGAEAAWDAAHVDEDWQIAEWGADAEAVQRRQRRWHEMQSAAEMLQLLDGDA